MNKHSEDSWFGKLDTMIATSRRLKDVLGVLVSAAEDITNASDVDVLLMDPENEILRLVSYTRPWEPGTVAKVLNEGKGIISSVVKSRQPRLWPDDELEESQVNYIAGLTDVRSELGVPILIGDDEVIGVINLESPRSGAFSQTHLEFMIQLADRSAIAIDRSRLFEQLLRAQDELGAFRELEKFILSRGGDREGDDHTDRAVLTKAIHAAASVLASDYADFWMFDPGDGVGRDVGRLTAVAATDERNIGRSQSMGEGVVGLAAKQLSPIRLADVTRVSNYMELLKNARSELAVPVVDQDERLRGVVNLENIRYDAYDKRDEEFVTDLMRPVLLGLDRQASIRRLEAVVSIGQTAVEMKDRDEIVLHILRLAVDVSNASLVDLVYYNGEYEVTGGMRAIRLAEDRGANTRSVTVERISEDLFHVYTGGIMEYVARNPVDYRYASDVRDDPLYREDPGQPGILSELAVPMRDRQGNLIGVLNYESPVTNGFSPNERLVCEQFAKQVTQVLVLARTRLREEQTRLREAEQASAVEIGHATGLLSHHIGNRLGLLPDELDQLARLAAVEGQSDLHSRLLRMKEVVDSGLQYMNMISEKALLSSDAYFEEPALISAIALVGPVVKELQHEASLKSSEIEIKALMTDPDVEVLLPQVSIGIAIRELVANAIRALDSSAGGWVEIEVSRIGDFLEVSVSDNGPGVAEEVRDSLFALGEKASSGGHGIGLWGVKKAIIAVGGSIEYVEEQRPGAKFVMRLPVGG